MKKKNKLIDVWIFTALVFIITLTIGWYWRRGINIPLFTIPISVGLLGFLFWVFVYRKPIAEIYSQIYPYKKLKLWGALSAFVFFEYIVVWGLYTKQLKLIYSHFYSIIVIFIGAIAFYFSFVRMKVSLRFLFLSIFVPVLALGSAIGLGKYFGFVNFLTPKEEIIKTIFLNTSYWIIFNILYLLVCEELAFRGFLMQRLIERGVTRAVIASSFIYAVWHIAITLFAGINISQGVLSFAENFIVGCFLALLFIKGKNLLIAAISHGIINGLKTSLFAGEKHPGLGQYFQMATPLTEPKFIMLWLGCLFIGTMLVLITRQKGKTSLRLGLTP